MLARNKRNKKQVSDQHTNENRRADQIVGGIYVVLSNISKDTVSLHPGITNCRFRKLVRRNLNKKS